MRRAFPEHLGGDMRTQFLEFALADRGAQTVQAPVKAPGSVETILVAERLKRARQPGIPAFIETLTRGA